MNDYKAETHWHRRLLPFNLSLQHRLPLLICILLCSIILTFSLASYYGVKNASLEIGKKRLRTLTDQLGQMFSQSSQTLAATMVKAAKQDSVVKCLQSGGVDFRDETLSILSSLRRDSTWILIELLDSTKEPVLSSGPTAVKAKLSTQTIFSDLAAGKEIFKAGKIYAAGDSMYYPMVTTISEKNRALGYIVIWRSLSATPQALEQISQLIGTGAKLYLGNSDGSLWTDFIKPVPQLMKDTMHLRDFLQYTDYKGKKVMAAVQPIASTAWLVLVEFSEDNILEAASRFLTWISIVSAVLIPLGIFITWLMSRNITRPLNQLTTAATALAAGDHLTPVKVHRMDELGKLAHAFNMMTAQIHGTQVQLENKVKERTTQLETVNKDLESFSYSVSHDLRAPLRAIAGYTSLLERDQNITIDPEVKRLTSKIKTNTIKMGTLIDDLLSFSKVGRHEINKKSINTDELVKDVVSGFDNYPGVKWNIHPLPQIRGDVNAMRQVWINLVGNAIKYSRNNSQPVVEIGSFSREGQTAFFVKDNGVGFDQAYADRLFKVFQRLHKTDEFEGTGIGLAIVEKIITKHGGRVWTEAVEGKGATFSFSIPES